MLESKIQQLCSYKQSIQYCYACDSVQCRRGYYFRAWVLYFSFGTYYDVNIKQFCSSSMYKHNF